MNNEYKGLTRTINELLARKQMKAVPRHTEQERTELKNVARPDDDRESEVFLRQQEIQKKIIDEAEITPPTEVAPKQKKAKKLEIEDIGKQPPTKVEINPELDNTPNLFASTETKGKLVESEKGGINTYKKPDPKEAKSRIEFAKKVLGRSSKSPYKDDPKDPASKGRARALLKRYKIGEAFQGKLVESFPKYPSPYKLVNKDTHVIEAEGSKKEMHRRRKKEPDKYYVGNSPGKKPGEKFNRGNIAEDWKHPAVDPKTKKSFDAANKLKSHQKSHDFQGGDDTPDPRARREAEDIAKFTRQFQGKSFGGFKITGTLTDKDIEAGAKIRARLNKLKESKDQYNSVSIQYQTRAGQWITVRKILNTPNMIMLAMRNVQKTYSNNRIRAIGPKGVILDFQPIDPADIVTEMKKETNLNELKKETIYRFMTRRWRQPQKNTKEMEKIWKYSVWPAQDRLERGVYHTKQGDKPYHFESSEPSEEEKEAFRKFMKYPSGAEHEKGLHKALQDFRAIHFRRKWKETNKETNNEETSAKELKAAKNRTAEAWWKGKPKSLENFKQVSKALQKKNNRRKPYDDIGEGKQMSPGVATIERVTRRIVNEILTYKNSGSMRARDAVAQAEAQAQAEEEAAQQAQIQKAQKKGQPVQEAKEPRHVGIEVEDPKFTDSIQRATAKAKYNAAARIPYKHKDGTETHITQDLGTKIHDIIHSAPHRHRRDIVQTIHRSKDGLKYVLKHSGTARRDK